MRAWLIWVCLLVGCGTRGRPLREWMLEIDGGPPGVAVTLPAHLRDRLPAGEVDYTLTTEVTLAPGERGRDLVLMVDCFHGPLALTVDGVRAPDVGDGGVGVWRFAIGRRLTDRETLTLRFLVHRDPRTMFGFGAPPRLGEDLEGDARNRRVASFNRYAAIAAILCLALLAVFYGALYALEKRRREYLAIMIYGLTLINVPLGALGVYFFDGVPAGIQLQVLIQLVNLVSLLYFLHGTFQLGPVRRGWLYLHGAFALIAFASFVSHRLALVLQPATVVPIVAVNVYTFARMVALARRDVDARLMLVGTIWHAACFIQGLVWAFSGTSPLGGAHPMSVGIAISGVMQGIILARQHAARQRAAAAANAELQHQVAERSKELGDALARIARSSQSEIEAGRIVDGRYRVIRPIGAGGMGSVFEVETVDDGRRMALKTVRGHASADLLARFAREAQVAAALEHPNIVPVLDVGVIDGGMFLVMPLVEGGSLDGERARYGDPRWAVAVLAQIAAGLAALHERAIVHRDLKPANVLLSGGVARIADFGLASLAARRPTANDGLADTVTGNLHRVAPASPPLTRAGDVFGTPRYMAPELAGGIHAPSASADVYAFGLLACELLTRAYPFAVPPIVTVTSGRSVPEPDLSRVPAEWRDLVARCLSLDPHARPTASELAGKLRP